MCPSPKQRAVRCPLGTTTFGLGGKLTCSDCPAGFKCPNPEWVSFIVNEVKQCMLLHNFHSIKWALWVIGWFWSHTPTQIQMYSNQDTTLLLPARDKYGNTSWSTHDFKMAWFSAHANVSGPDNTASLSLKQERKNALIKPMCYNFQNVSNGMVRTILFSNQDFWVSHVIGKRTMTDHHMEFSFQIKFNILYEWHLQPWKISAMLHMSCRS